MLPLGEPVLHARGSEVLGPELVEQIPVLVRGAGASCAASGRAGADRTGAHGGPWDDERMVPVGAAGRGRPAAAAAAGFDVIETWSMQGRDFATLVPT